VTSRISVELASVMLIAIASCPVNVAGSTPPGAAHRIVVTGDQPWRRASGVGSNGAPVFVLPGNAPTGTSRSYPVGEAGSARS